jgi:HAD superfamily hydrolase (TIGR01549 family)
MIHKELILFDLGGTLIYFEGNWGEAVAESDRLMQAWLEAAGFRLTPNFSAVFNGRIRSFLAAIDTDFIEVTAEYFLRSLMAEEGYPSVPDGIIRGALNVKFAATQQQWKIEQEAHPTLEILKERGFRMGLVSNAGDKNDVETMLERLGLRPYFEHVLISAEAGIRKPNPRIFQMALEAFAIGAEKAVMVGDTLGADILGAQAAGIQAVYITRRADRADNRAHEDTIVPDVVIGSLEELPGILS